MAKSILEYIFLGIALLIVTLIILRRFIILKRRNQPYTAFFRPDTPIIRLQHVQRPPLSPNNISNYTIASAAHRHDLDGHLSRYPAAYFGQGQRRTHAHDIDTSGRRLGNTTFLDHDGELGDKDALPAYDNVGGPPKYNELELQYRLSSVENGSSHPAEQSSIRITGGRAEAIPGDERQRALSLSSPRNSNNQGNVNDIAVTRIGPTLVE
ncbi:hypothetical protein BDN70DRAFT_110365 [Pholiota conissans]|uniref:Uncharacterized protein n=1 Tax=Pholiota conissans TaxID=109636 RepID=A0A9P5YX60_9AGAR|nr:hypothetical protein BDN70DRAFT_110365 [Pholiota conissans]